MNERIGSPVIKRSSDPAAVERSRTPHHREFGPSIPLAPWQARSRWNVATTPQPVKSFSLASTRTQSAPSVPITYFPRAETPPVSKGHRTKSSRPTTVEPIFDKVNAKKPIGAFDEKAHSVNYAEQPSEGITLPIPTKPSDFDDPYLFPFLTKNERLRLTMLWYYTKGLMEDSALLARLQDKLTIARELIGWEFAIMGVLDNDVYTRVATSGLPLAILPRRESTCAHTINQPAGSVFMLSNMLDDWRFQHSPHVEIGGLRSYAGTQLLCKTESGPEVALGSLCVASNSQMEPLTAEKQAALVRFADMLSAELITTSQINRERQRRLMGDLISKIQVEATAHNVEELVRATVQKVYSNAQISIQSPTNECISLKSRPPVAHEDFQDGMWEDSDYIDLAIVSMNQEKLNSNQTVRAIAYQCISAPISKYLVVETTKVQLVFDDIDAWFIERCSLLVNKLFQERSIKEAVEIKDRFFRGITHQLRTPIHGILGSCELLNEELTAMNAFSAPVSPQNRIANTAIPANASSYLDTIKSSGEELMSTINNMLKLNRWSQIANTPPTQNSYDLRQLESELCNELPQLVPECELSQVILYFHRDIPDEASLVLVDASLLIECLQSLLVNAVQYTSYGGSVVVVISTDATFSTLCFDVIDTGCGIKPEDQQRVFRPYEKANEHSRGAGLGLTLASKIAVALNGTVTLVSSGEGRGSHFRASFHEPSFSCRYSRVSRQRQIQYLPKHCQRILHPRSRSLLSCDYFMRYFEQLGLELSGGPPNSLGIISFTEDSAEFAMLLDSINADQVAICLVPADATSCLPNKDRSSIHFFTGPFSSARLDEIVTHVDKQCELRSLETIPQTPLALDVPVCAFEKAPDKPLQLASSDAPLSSLIVDDNPINLRIMSMYCEKRHIPFTAAVDGQEAVDRYKSCAANGYPSLVLLDLQMPHMDGAVACEEIRRVETERSLKPSVIFIVSGQDSPADKARCFRVGANDFLVKPVRLKALDLRIKDYFSSFEGRE